MSREENSAKASVIDVATYSDSERHIDKLESQLPALSGQMFSEALESHLKAGRSVLVIEGENIFEVFPDGARKFVKKTAPSITANSGVTINIQ